MSIHPNKTHALLFSFYFVDGFWTPFSILIRLFTSCGQPLLFVWWDIRKPRLYNDFVQTVYVFCWSSSHLRRCNWALQSTYTSWPQNMSLCERIKSARLTRSFRWELSRPSYVLVVLFALIVFRNSNSRSDFKNDGTSSECLNVRLLISNR